MVAAASLAVAATVAAAPLRPPAAQPPPATGPRPEQGRDDRGQPVTVDSDKMERFGREGLVVFTGNVVVRRP